MELVRPERLLHEINGNSRGFSMRGPVQKEGFVFGPVPSRRLGLSLGINLIPQKTCPFDCVYCECGPTTKHTAERREFCPTAEVIAEIDAVLSKGPELNYATFSGMGEPALHSGLEKILRHLKTKWPDVKVCLITNGIPLRDPSLRTALGMLDLIMPSLDASTPEEFQKINRPAKNVTFEDLVDSLISFRTQNPAVPMWLEVFLVPGINDSPDSIERFIEIIRKIGPDRIQLNSIDRPGTENWVQAPTRARLEELARAFAPAGNVEIISRVRPAPPENPARTCGDLSIYNRLILDTVRARPCTASDIAVVLKCQTAQAADHLRQMKDAGLLISEEGGRGTFYRPAPGV